MIDEPWSPTTETELSVSWVMGSDVLNVGADHMDAVQRRLAEEMLEGRDCMTLDQVPTRAKPAGRSNLVRWRAAIRHVRRLVR